MDNLHALICDTQEKLGRLLDNEEIEFLKWVKLQDSKEKRKCLRLSH